MNREQVERSIRLYRGDLASVEDSQGLLERLFRLPCSEQLELSGVVGQIEQHRDYVDRVKRAELELRQLRESAYLHAVGVLDFVLGNWETEEVVKAVGYEDV